MTPSARTVINNLVSARFKSAQIQVPLAAAKSVLVCFIGRSRTMAYRVLTDNSFRAFLIAPETEIFYTRIVATFFIFVVSLLGEAQVIVVPSGPCLTSTCQPSRSQPSRGVSPFSAYPGLYFSSGSILEPVCLPSRRYCAYLTDTCQQGVILSTAFVHLLQDSFESLRCPEVRARWNVGEYVGLIVFVLLGCSYHTRHTHSPPRLCSLLAIFLVECKCSLCLVLPHFIIDDM